MGKKEEKGEEEEAEQAAEEEEEEEEEEDWNLWSSSQPVPRSLRKVGEMTQGAS